MDRVLYRNSNFSSISQLAENVKINADKLARFATGRGLELSLDADGSSLPLSKMEEDMIQARLKLLDDIKQLQGLVKGPLGILMDIGANEILCLQAICRFKIAQSMGEDKEIKFDTLSERCKLNVKDLQRILRYAMTNFIFCEPRPGVVRHTLASKMLANDNQIRDLIENICEVRFPASAHVVDALQRYGLSKHPCESGFSLSRNTQRGLYDELAQHPCENQRWNGAMSALAQQIDMNWISASFREVMADGNNPLVVDVGGGRGDVSLELAQRLPNASFVVQDMSRTAIEQGQRDSRHLEDRVRFDLHDFRNRQPLADADIYFFRNIFHNWPDASCIEILRNQVPALKPGAHILIIDFTLHEPGTLPWSEERRRRWMDINMLVFFGSRERTIEDWHSLLQTADPRFELIGVDSAPSQHDSILRIEWRP